MVSEMTIDELIKELQEIKERNTEPDVPNFDPGSIEVFVQSEAGTFESEIQVVEQANDVWFIVDEPGFYGDGG
jgi:hypothetical protein